MTRPARSLRHPPARQRGVALLLALLAMALAVLLAVSLLDRGDVARARSLQVQRSEQTAQLQIGLEAWAGVLLGRDPDGAQMDAADAPWLTPLPPIDVPGARISGRLVDQGGCFNLNALHVAGADDALALARFERLLARAGLRGEIAAQAADWLDADASPRAGGVESLRDPATGTVRPMPGAPFLDVQELRLLPAMDARSFERLQPLVCALPADHRINLNRADPLLWMSLDDAIDAAAAQRLSRGGQARYASLEAVAEELQRLGLPPLSLEGTTVGTGYVRLEALIEADGLPFVWHSLLRRTPDGAVVVWRR